MTESAPAKTELHIALVAGELSGDLLAASMMLALRQELEACGAVVHFCGIGGPQMRSLGMDSWWPAESLAVHGYAEALRHYHRISGIRRDVLRRLRRQPPALFIGIDAPDFNLGLEARLKSRGVPTLHYVSPSVWAWRRGRIKKICRSADRLLALFPFEPPLYAQARLPVTFVGHPLADAFPLESLRVESRMTLNLTNSEATIVAVLPGSRDGEVERMSTPYIQAMRHLHERFPDAQFLVPLATRSCRDLFEAQLWQQNAQSLPIRLLYGHSQDALAAADVALVTSGTATLEAMLLKTPMVIAYRVSPLSAMIMRRMRYQPWVGLPNILAGKFIAPEFVQEEVNPKDVAQAVGQLIQDKGDADCQVDAFRAIHLSLRQGAAVRCAQAAVQLLREKGKLPS